MAWPQLAFQDYLYFPFVTVFNLSSPFQLLPLPPSSSRSPIPAYQRLSRYTGLWNFRVHLDSFSSSYLTYLTVFLERKAKVLLSRNFFFFARGGLTASNDCPSWRRRRRIENRGRDSIESRFDKIFEFNKLLIEITNKFYLHKLFMQRFIVRNVITIMNNYKRDYARNGSVIIATNKFYSSI